MNKLMSLLILITIFGTGAQAFGQLSKDSTSIGPQPLPPHEGPDDTPTHVMIPGIAPPVAKSAFYTSYDAFVIASNEANYWRTMQGYHPNAALAAHYFQTSASYQYGALVQSYSVWRDLEVNAKQSVSIELLVKIRDDAKNAKMNALYAWWYAAAGRSVVGPSCEPAIQSQQDAHDELQFLIDVLSSINWVT